jgi:hypothetical protein
MDENNQSVYTFGLLIAVLVSDFMYQSPGLLAAAVVIVLLTIASAFRR